MVKLKRYNFVFADLRRKLSLAITQFFKTDCKITQKFGQYQKEIYNG